MDMDSPCILAHFRANLRAASFASVPEFAKNTLSANEFSTSFFANFTCRYKHESHTVKAI